MINFGDPGLTFVEVFYQILDSQGNLVHELNKTVSVQTQSEFIESFDVSNFEPGEYMLLAEITYEG